MSKTNKTPVQVTKSIKGYFDQSGSVSNYDNKTSLIINHFKERAIKKLSEYGIALEWANVCDESCSIQIKLVEIDTGNQTLRGIISWTIPVFISTFVGPATIFEVEGQYSEDSKNVPFRYREKNRNANVGTEMSMRIASGTAAFKLAEDIKGILNAK